MKKLILFAAILFAGVSVVSAAEPITSAVNFKLNLHAFQSIEVGGGDQGTIDGETGLVNGEVVLDYSTVKKYDEGVSRTISDHIIIQSAGGFVVKVKSDVDNLSDTSGAADVSMSTIALTAQEKGLHKSDIEKVSLSAESTPFISSESGFGKEMKFDVTYSGAGGNAYGAFVRKDGTVRNLETTITYEMFPR